MILNIPKTLLTAVLSSLLFTGCVPNLIKSDKADSIATNESYQPLKLPINQTIIEQRIDENNINREFTQDTLQQHTWLINSKPEPLDKFIWKNKHPVHNNIWHEMSNHFYLAPAHTEKYQDYIQYYLKHPNHLKRVSKRAEPYLYFILEEIKKRQMPYEIALLPIVESGFSPFAKSYVSATGLWQFMPATGQMFGLYQSWWFEGRQDVYKSTHAALDYLQSLYKRNNHDWLLALASYNCGHGNVRKAKRNYLKKNPNGVVNFWTIRNYLPKETQHYVPQLLAISYLIDHQSDYGVLLEPIENTAFFTKIELNQQISLPKLAKETNLSLDKIKLLNPGFLRSATPPTGSFKLLLPVDIANSFAKKLQQKPSLFEVNWLKHKIKSGESLSVIAQKYNTSSKQIKKLNGLKNSKIRAGETLLIPTSINYTKKFTKQTPKNHRGKKIAYTLKKGDSLWKVAKKHSVTTTDLSRWNNIEKSQILQPGTKINIWIKG